MVGIGLTDERFVVKQAPPTFETITKKIKIHSALFGSKTKPALFGNNYNFLLASD